MSAPAIRPLACRPNPAAAPFVALGLACVIGGGLVSAALATDASYHSSWAVAYVVLVAGVAQAALGAGQAILSGGEVAARTRAAELVAWNVGNAAVIIGTLFDVKALLYLGAVLLVATLATVLHAVRQAAPGRLLMGFRVVVVLLLVSIPV
ncbi:MAG: hypothetical protein EPN43_09760, partial [Jatrophihabitans sp.]